MHDHPHIFPVQAGIGQLLNNQRRGCSAQVEQPVISHGGGQVICLFVQPFGQTTVDIGISKIALEIRGSLH